MSSQVFSVHPQNHRCFLFKGQPFKILTSAEHYGAVMNADFDYDVYLRELRRTGENMTRVFAFFREMHPSVCTGEADTLGPRPGAVVSPWLRVPGHGQAADGLDRFDLDQWNPAYFSRLRDFSAKCARQGVVCEITLFGDPYDWPRWNLCPCSATSNVNGVGASITHPYEAMTLSDPTVVAFQERFVRKMAEELNDLDNFYHLALGRGLVDVHEPGALARLEAQLDRTNSSSSRSTATRTCRRPSPIPNCSSPYLARISKWCYGVDRGAPAVVGARARRVRRHANA